MVRLLARVAMLDADQADDKKRALMHGLCQLVDGDGWLWTMTRVDLARNSPMSMGLMHGGLTDEQVAGWVEMSHDLKHPPPEHAPLANELRKGRHFTRSRDQVVADEEWYAHPVVRQYRLDRGIDHFLYSIYPLDEPGVMSGVGLYRKCGRPAFTHRERRITHILLSEVEWLHYADLPRDHGSGVPGLSPRQRVVLVLLLQGRYRDEIASLLHISPHTAKDHIKAIYQHFQVGSQVELICRFKAGDGGDLSVT